mmetsp:Transcript_508/g.695  ORF Transcript_508/g.695 Transcript_508/m.695 type:complete len:289 (+) Transcript_508:443-1309(+)
MCLSVKKYHGKCSPNSTDKPRFFSSKQLVMQQTRRLQRLALLLTSNQPFPSFKKTWNHFEFEWQRYAKNERQHSALVRHQTKPNPNQMLKYTSRHWNHFCLVKPRLTTTSIDTLNKLRSRCPHAKSLCASQKKFRYFPHRCHTLSTRLCFFESMRNVWTCSRFLSLGPLIHLTKTDAFALTHFCLPTTHRNPHSVSSPLRAMVQLASTRTCTRTAKYVCHCWALGLVQVGIQKSLLFSKYSCQSNRSFSCQIRTLTNLDTSDLGAPLKVIAALMLITPRFATTLFDMQ